jgi:hypothetical protein
MDGWMDGWIESKVAHIGIMAILSLLDYFWEL